ncbi:FIG00027233: possible membrane protein [hydrothermal vent metagenome]|uniref:FIG00027233: possible membrane protein n=1 Tax=hydrothermal vent metagenome TaxID=652676 RepID=A0A3B0SRR9_9ZZZZ
MKKFAISAMALVFSAGMTMADPLEGLWRTAGDDNGDSGLIKVAPCGNQLCGTLIKAYDANGAEIESDNIGRNIISETVARGGGSYTGKVYSPDRDKTYKSKLQMTGDTLKVRGCIAFICRDGGTWQKVN